MANYLEVKSWSFVALSKEVLRRSGNCEVGIVSREDIISVPLLAELCKYKERELKIHRIQLGREDDNI